MNNDIVQLTDKNGNNVFPIAGSATQNSISKSMLEEGVFEGPELFPAPSEAYVRTENIVDGAVTSDKIDWTTSFQTYTDNAGRTGIYFPDGTLIAKRRIVKQNVSVTVQWGSMYRGVVSDWFSLAPSGSPDFVEAPTVQVNLTASGTTSVMQASWGDMTPTTNNPANRYAIPNESIAVIRPTSASVDELYIDIIAVGRWE